MDDNSDFAKHVEAARDSLAKVMDPSQVVTRAGTMLRMAEQGVRDMQEKDHDRILLGFLAVVVFGRSMTLVMQKLRGHDRVTFDAWYEPWTAEMIGDPLMEYFADLRTKVIHHHDPAIGIMLGGFGPNVPPPGSISVDDMPLPEHHLGAPLNGKSMLDLAQLYVAYLQRVFDSFAPMAFAIQDRHIAASRQ